MYPDITFLTTFLPGRPALHHRPYAEEVEDRLKNIGLAVDMLFPRAGAPINHVSRPEPPSTT